MIKKENHLSAYIFELSYNYYFWYLLVLSIILINSSGVHRMDSQVGKSQAEVICMMKFKFEKEGPSSQCPQPQGRPLYRVPKADSRVPTLR